VSITQDECVSASVVNLPVSPTFWFPLMPNTFTFGKRNVIIKHIIMNITPEIFSRTQNYLCGGQKISNTLISSKNFLQQKVDEV